MYEYQRKNKKQTIVVTPIKDLKPSTAFPDIYKKCERYKIQEERERKLKEIGIC
jgi:hypothetical protein